MDILNNSENQRIATIRIKGWLILIFVKKLPSLWRSTDNSKYHHFCQQWDYLSNSNRPTSHIIVPICYKLQSLLRISLQMTSKQATPEAATTLAALLQSEPDEPLSSMDWTVGSLASTSQMVYCCIICILNLYGT